MTVLYSITMRKIFIIGNWKTYPMQGSIDEWVASGVAKKTDIEKTLQAKDQEAVVIVCPPMTRMYDLQQAIINHHAENFINIASQDLSAFPPGAHTGDESAEELKKRFGITYTLIGHSERRRDYGEKDDLLTKKVEQALQYGIIPIYCVQDEKDTIPQGVTIVAYEPPYAISAMSGGVAEDPQKTEYVANIVREKLLTMYNNSQETFVLYGGSVNAANVASFTNNPKLKKSFDGALVGAKSLIPEFFQIVENA